MFSVYLAWNLTHYRLFLCPPFFLDPQSKFSWSGWSGVGWGLERGLGLDSELGPKSGLGPGLGSGLGLGPGSKREPEVGSELGLDTVWTQLAALTPPLPLGLADYVLNYLAGESEKQPSGAKLSAAVKQVPPGSKVSGWLYLGWMLRRWWRVTTEPRQGAAELRQKTAEPRHGMAESRQSAADTAEYGQIAGAVDSALPAAVECLLRERRQLARQVLLRLEAKALPPELRLDAEGYLRQLGSLTDDLTSSSSICSSSVNLADSTDLAAGLEAELLWLERFLAGRALLPKEVQTLLAENQDRLPAALRDSGFWNREAAVEAGEASIDPAKLRESDGRVAASTGVETSIGAVAGVWVPARIQAAFQVLALQGRALLRPAVGRDLRGQPICFRCGQSDQLKTAVCGHCGRRACYYCESCNSLGLARECLPLYLVPGLKPTSGKSDTAEQERDLAAKLHTKQTGKPHVDKSDTAEQAKDLAASAPVSVPASVPVQLEFPLTPAQQRAAEEVRQFAAASPLKQCLVWAVCGAGKTEVVFPALAEALARGGPVLYATPRRDVVQELAPRLKQAFPSFRVSQLYAGSGERFAPADIYAATTHQTLRFYQNFDLVILDEVDAYPYRDSPLLHYAVLRASRPGGKIIYLTATPSAAMQQQARGGRELAVVYIPARHHGFPVPEPELIGESRLRWPGEDSNSNLSRNQNRNRNQNQNQKLELPGSVVDLIQRTVVEERSQLLIFVPAVRLAGIVAEAVSRQVEFDQLKWPMELAKLAESEQPIKPERRGEPVKHIKAVQQIKQNKQNKQNEKIKQVQQIRQVEKIKQNEQIETPAFPWVQASHAGDPQREQKRQGFSQGDFPILVTTTILERGITIPRVNVLVLFADAEKIFDEGSLVQMAGRVGRTAAYPQGKVWLVGSRVSPAMRSAQARIREMNRRARALGCLHEGRGEAGQNAK